MKAGIHPDNYRLVVFEDLNDGTRFLIKSTAKSKESVKWEDGKSYPLVKLHVTSASHPFYTGLEKVIDVEGRIDKFQARFKTAQKAKSVRQAKTAKLIKQTAAKTARNKAAAEAKIADSRRRGKKQNKHHNKPKQQKPQAKVASKQNPQKQPAKKQASS